MYTAAQWYSPDPYAQHILYVQALAYTENKAKHSTVGFNKPVMLS
jgi:hypothetical protein